MYSYRDLKANEEACEHFSILTELMDQNTILNSLWTFMIEVGQIITSPGGIRIDDWRLPPDGDDSLKAFQKASSESTNFDNRLPLQDFFFDFSDLEKSGRFSLQLKFKECLIDLPNIHLEEFIPGMYNEKWAKYHLKLKERDIRIWIFND